MSVAARKRGPLPAGSFSFARGLPPWWVTLGILAFPGPALSAHFGTLANDLPDHLDARHARYGRDEIRAEEPVGPFDGQSGREGRNGND
jgi:hypothetical protein